jgi:uncharacterized membrane protein
VIEVIDTQFTQDYYRNWIIFPATGQSSGYGSGGSSYSGSAGYGGGSSMHGSSYGGYSRPVAYGGSSYGYSRPVASSYSSGGYGYGGGEFLFIIVHCSLFNFCISATLKQ